MFKILIVYFCCSLKIECEKLASEKIEIQRHYVMVSIIYQISITCRQIIITINLLLNSLDM